MSHHKKRDPRQQTMEAFYDRAHQVELTTVDVNDNDHIVPCSFHEFYSSVRRAAFALAISLLGRWACSLISLWLVARVLLRVAQQRPQPHPQQHPQHHPLLMLPQAVVAVATAESPLRLVRVHRVVGVPCGAAARGAAAVLA